MLSWSEAQGLVDALCALTLAGSVLGLIRQATPLRPQLGFAFGSLSVFFAARAGFHVMGWPGLEFVQRLVASALPLAALLLAEAVLRRHAPQVIKLFVAGGAVVALAAALLAQPVSDAILATYVVLSLAIITVLLLARDKASLSRQENASVAALVASGLLVTAASITDFIPALPVGLSGVGAASVAFVMAASPTSVREARRVIGEFAALALVATAVGLALARLLHLNASADIARLAAVLLGLLLAAGAIVRALGAQGGGRRTELAAALARADTSRLERFLGDVADQPLLAGLRLVEGAQLRDYDTDGLAAALGARRVWTLGVLAAAEVAARPREELADMLARAEATHAVIVSGSPLRIALLTLPDGGPAHEVDVELALFGKLASIAAQGRS
jgi:hypothetical protein